MSEVVRTKHIYIVRHGESLGNKEGFSQLEETPLTETGHQQAEVLAERCKHLRFDLLVSSNMLRAQETAQHIASATGKEILVNEFFHEKQTPLTVREKSIESDEYAAYITEVEKNYLDPTWTLPGMESHMDLLKRADQAIDFLITAEEDNILVVTHGTFMKYLVGRMIFTGALSPDICRTILLSFQSDNTSITHCKYIEHRWRLITWNDHAHFAE